MCVCVCVRESCCGHRSDKDSERDGEREAECERKGVKEERLSVAVNRASPTVGFPFFFLTPASH